MLFDTNNLCQVGYSILVQRNPMINVVLFGNGAVCQVGQTLLDVCRILAVASHPPGVVSPRYEVLGCCRTEHMSPHLISVRCELSMELCKLCTS